MKTYTKADFDKRLAPNFTVREFACKCGCGSLVLDEELPVILQKIRDRFGAAVIINSGYRCEKHNAAVGGVKGSRHTKGQAADIRVVGIAPAKVAAYAETIGVLGVGLYGDFVHVDTRDYKSFWYGHQEAYRTTFGGYTPWDFVKDVQRAIGAAVDGIAGPETIGKTVTLADGKNARHAAVKAVQKRLYALGYTMVGEADGIAGPKFTKAVKAYQKDNGCIADGEISAECKTWRKLLGMV